MFIATLASTVLSVFAAPPVCTPATVVTNPGVPVAVQPSCVDTGAAPTYVVTTQPVGGAVTGVPGTYTPAAGFKGADFLRYTVKNNDTGETSQETTINLVVNDRLPSCGDGATATTQVGRPLQLKGSDLRCSDPDGTAVMIHAENGLHGVVDPGVGTEITYKPDPGYVGTDEISYYGMDGAFMTVTRTLAITITPAPGATPTASPSPSASATPTPIPTAAPPADTTGPVLTVKAGKASIAKGVALTLKSNEAGTAKLTLAAGKAKATKSAKLVNGTTKVTLKLGAKARKALAKKRSVKATLNVVATDAAGNRTTKTVKVTLRR